MDWVAALAGMPAALAAKEATSYHSSPSQGFGSTRGQVADDRNYRLGLLRLTLGLEPPAKRIGCSTATRLCGCAGGRFKHEAWQRKGGAYPLSPLRALRPRTPDPAWSWPVVGEGVRSCPRARCGQSASPVR